MGKKFILNSRFKQTDSSCSFSISKEFIPHRWSGSLL